MKTKQEIIPVGCVPTAAVATTRCQYRGGEWGLPLEGVLPRGRGEVLPLDGGSASGGGLPLEGGLPTPTPRGQNDTRSENITYPRLRSVKIASETIRQLNVPPNREESGAYFLYIFCQDYCS